MNTSHYFSKSDAQRIHAKRRFMQRKQIDFDRQLRRHVIWMIRNNHARLVQKTSNRVSVWDVLVLGTPCRVVYDSKRGNIVTVLPGKVESREQRGFIL